MNLPKYRTAKYSIWKACELFGLRPPGVSQEWDNNSVIAKAELLAYAQIRGSECTSMANFPF